MAVLIILMVWRLDPLYYRPISLKKTKVPLVDVLEDGEQDRLLDDAEQKPNDYPAHADAIITQFEYMGN
jgi:hypothetical protein